MANDLNTVVTVDHTNGMRRIRDHSYNRARTVHLRFTKESDSRGYLVQAWGSAFPEDGCGGYQGRLARTVDTVNSGIDILRTAWQTFVVEHEHTDAETGRTSFPFVDNWDLATPADRHRINEIGPRSPEPGTPCSNCCLETAVTLVCGKSPRTSSGRCAAART